ncbi:MAG: prepilin peptidase [bacterium]
MELILIVLFGLIIGSFLNVVIYRLPRNVSIVKPRSYCVHCKKKINFYDNIPLISYFLLKGKCRNCKAKISWRYPFVEALTAYLFVVFYLRYGLTEEWFFSAVLVIFLIPISIIDIDKGIIPNKLVFPCLIIGIVLTLLLRFETSLDSLLGAITGGIFFLVLALLGKFLFKKDSIGMGDGKLLVTIGFYTGLAGFLITFFFIGLLSGFFVIIGFIAKKINFGSTIPFGPFIALSTVIVKLLFEGVMVSNSILISLI